MEVIRFLETGLLPGDEKRAKPLALTQSQYLMKDDVLYRVEQDGTLRIIPTSKSREKLVKEYFYSKLQNILERGGSWLDLSRDPIVW